MANNAPIITNPTRSAAIIKLPPLKATDATAEIVTNITYYTPKFILFHH